LDEGDNDSTRFLAYLVTAVQTIAPNIGTETMRLLQSPQPPPAESILTILLNEIATSPDKFILVLDDYHVIEDDAVPNALIL
jgi:LuxR family maltose regulon positive regulatory protein